MRARPAAAGIQASNLSVRSISGVTSRETAFRRQRRIRASGRNLGVSRRPDRNLGVEFERQPNLGVNSSAPNLGAKFELQIRASGGGRNGDPDCRVSGCMYVFMYVCMYVCMYVYVYMYIHIRICIYISVYIYIKMCMYMYVSICIYTHVYIDTWYPPLSRNLQFVRDHLDRDTANISEMCI